MNAPSGQWTSGRFWSVAVGLFVAQTGLIYLFAEAGRGPFKGSPAPVHFHLLGAPLSADELTRMFFAIDPVVFAHPGLHGFSGRGWLQAPAAQLDAPEEQQSPAWLELDPSRLGANFPVARRAESQVANLLYGQGVAESGPWPSDLSEQSGRQRSSFAVEGGLSQRRLNAPSQLRSWPGAELLSNSVVQIAVDSAGQVVAARLLGRSGSTDADTNALAEARHLRFHPVPSSPPVWGRVVFEWQTLALTNAPASGAP